MGFNLQWWKMNTLTGTTHGPSTSWNLQTFVMALTIWETGGGLTLGHHKDISLQYFTLDSVIAWTRSK